MIFVFLGEKIVFLKGFLKFREITNIKDSVKFGYQVSVGVPKIIFFFYSFFKPLKTSFIHSNLGSVGLKAFKNS